ncbi:glycosyltransferase family 4 protein [Qipengyuania marisflavi]|uniref:Glycosyltransferase family 4 protein n=1 Tax=Qipengyuania marisflavi TaxID=2486356 RepID=A0A5S3P641_9SPHN|nr:glycosyltransferase family 4 protein [Qipengyuania marisflavi]TMM48406.1 glycosyltransferase family 4 protein [Qipengyuania marisflavi]
MKVAVFHPGTQHSRQTALALQQLELLAFLATSLFDHPGRKRWPGPLGRAMDTALAGHRFPALDPALVRTHGAEEWVERIAAKLGARRLARRIDRLGNRRFGGWLAGEAARETPLALWGFNGASARAFADPRLRDCPKILDRTVADWRFWNAELEVIRASHPGWLAEGPWPAEAAQIARDDLEYAHADRIVCGSPFVAQSIRDHSAAAGLDAKLTVLPYPFDTALFGGAPEPVPPPSGEPVRFLFAGQVSPRKGIQHVLEAVQRLPRRDARLSVMGPRMVPDRMLAPYAERIDWLSEQPRSAVPAIMRQHEALVFPSHYEGSAIILLEAMASGLAIIQSRQAGLGASANSGIVLDAPSADGVEQAMAAMAADRDVLLGMRRAAWRESQAFSFDAYRGNIAALLADMGI